MYVTIWSLKRWQRSGSGIIWPPQEIPEWDSSVCAAQDVAISEERDWPITQREYHQEELARGAYMRRRRGVA
jgi:hypothetical protein